MVSLPLLTTGLAIHIALLNLLWNIGGYELYKKEHWWIQHWQHFTRFLWRVNKLCTDGCAIYRSRFVISSWSLDLATWIYPSCIYIPKLIGFCRFLGKLLWKHREDVTISGIQYFSPSLIYFHLLYLSL